MILTSIAAQKLQFSSPPPPSSIPFYFFLLFKHFPKYRRSSFLGGGGLHCAFTLEWKCLYCGGMLPPPFCRQDPGMNKEESNILPIPQIAHILIIMVCLSTLCEKHANTSCHSTDLGTTAALTAEPTRWHKDVILGENSAVSLKAT